MVGVPPVLAADHGPAGLRRQTPGGFISISNMRLEGTEGFATVPAREDSKEAKACNYPTG